MFRIPSHADIYEKYTTGTSIKDLAKEYGVVQDRIRQILLQETRRDKGSWIPVEEYLPEDDSMDILITVEHEDHSQTVCAGFYDEGKWWANTERSHHAIGSMEPGMFWNPYEGDHVIAWMYAPAGYMAAASKAKQKKEEEENG